MVAVTVRIADDRAMLAWRQTTAAHGNVINLADSARDSVSRAAWDYVLSLNDRIARVRIIDNRTATR